MVSVRVEIRKSAPVPSAREPRAGSGSGKPASARPRSYPCDASHYVHVICRHKRVSCRKKTSDRASGLASARLWRGVVGREGRHDQEQLGAALRRQRVQARAIGREHHLAREPRVQRLEVHALAVHISPQQLPHACAGAARLQCSCLQPSVALPATVAKPPGAWARKAPRMQLLLHGSWCRSL